MTGDEIWELTNPDYPDPVRIQVSAVMAKAITTSNFTATKQVYGKVVQDQVLLEAMADQLGEFYFWMFMLGHDITEIPDIHDLDILERMIKTDYEDRVNNPT